ncbi:CocE/NonD family hydrolase C-terminal non-catalytic domain-containing protein [Streptomyces sp. I05A-00742]|uniref:S15 peptidase family protein n=1 Tax=Streptomyces sp. I05A-00742 TaxID=2732853 RepID=UPI0014894AFB|nr:CocE/NonD family hydrolase C-terminal non-catalytic domain-containing protein [Streptomyces sp. I05A-00742]
MTPSSSPSSVCRSPAGRRAAALLLALAGLLLALAVPVPPVRAADRPVARPFVFRGVGGTPLEGTVAEPAGRGPHPLLLLPCWVAMPEVLMRGIQLEAARRGFVAITYRTRLPVGPGASDLQGPRDVGDVSRAIDWALDHAHADVRHIGVGGVSYGAALGLLGAAHDRRISAVAALSGWVDAMDVLEDNGTPTLVSPGMGVYTSVQGRGALLGAVRRHDRARLAAWARPRSPLTYLDRYNARRVAMFFAHTWGEGVVPAPRLGDFFDRLRGPRRLEMRPGDHAGPEIAEALVPGELIRSVLRWMDRHVKGVDNGVDGEPPLLLRPVNSGPRFGAGYGWEGHAGWAAMTGATRRLFLGTGRSLREAPDGSTTGAALLTGPGSVTDNGLLMVQRSAEAALGAQVPRPLALVPRGVGAVWTSRPAAAPLYVRGRPRMRLTLTPGAGTGTVVVHLLDADARGNGTLMTWAPYTFSGRTPGRPFTVEVPLHATAYDLPAGHRLALVAGTADSRVLARNAPLRRITLSSPAGSPSWVDVPLR